MSETTPRDPARTEFSAADLGDAETALLLKSVLIPRPIAWVGTVADDGAANLAPHSFFTMVSGAPPIVMFSSTGRKDTLRNVEATGQFTVSLVDRALAEACNTTSAPVGPEVDEFVLAGLEKEASAVVAPPRVAASPAVLECTLERVVPVGDGHCVFGRVVHVAVREDTLVTDARGRTLPDPARLDPVARLGRDEWGTLGDVFAQGRPRA